MKRAISLALAAAMMVGLAACGGTSTKDENTYRVLYSGEVSTLNYLVSSSTDELKVAYNTIDCLVEYDSYGNVLPGLAESWEQDPENPEVWTFHLRKGVKWIDHNAQEVAEVTANDFVSSARYALDAANGSGTAYMMTNTLKNAAAYNDYTAYLVESENGTRTTNAEGYPIEPVEEVAFEDVGIKAVDDYTLQFTTDGVKPWFVSAVSFGCFYPVYGPFLEEKGDSFGTSNDTLLYCGAYYLETFEPQNRHVYQKNPSYWDKDKVYIETIEKKFNTEAGTLAPEMFKRGEIDEASISIDLVQAWMEDDATKDLVRPNRADPSYTYFISFNFEPSFDEQYQPENWIKAVNSENFRKSIYYGLDRVKSYSVQMPETPETLLLNTITPPAFAVGESGTDYTEMGSLAAITQGDPFDADQALEYKEAALADLEAAGASLPVIIPLVINPNETNCDKECQVIEQQLEGLLGTDYIDIQLVSGPSTGFLGEIRRAGKYGMLICNWGFDYADPENAGEPFKAGNSYQFMYTDAENGYTNKTAETQALVDEYYGMMEAASQITTSNDERYAAFAEAEAFLIEHAFVIPYHMSGSGYIASYLNPFEGQYAPFGAARERYKGQHLLEKPMSAAEFETALNEWNEKRMHASDAAS